MKGGPSVKVLLDLALGDDESVAQKSAAVLKTQVFLYEADMERIESSYKEGNETAKALGRTTNFPKLKKLYISVFRLLSVFNL